MAAVDTKMNKLIEADAPRQVVQIRVGGSVATHVSEYSVCLWGTVWHT